MVPTRPSPTRRSISPFQRTHLNVPRRTARPGRYYASIPYVTETTALTSFSIVSVS
jgi:hypothetical protein